MACRGVLDLQADAAGADNAQARPPFRQDTNILPSTSAARTLPPVKLVLILLRS